MNIPNNYTKCNVKYPAEHHYICTLNLVNSSFRKMDTFNRKAHWEQIYSTKQLNEVSWYQPIPETSLAYLKEFNIPLHARIIDMGGGDSFWVDHLLELGYQDITVLDISAHAIDRAKARLGTKAGMVKWIIADAAHFQPPEQYDFWHDRAAFHFLTEEEDIQKYRVALHQGLSPEGIAVIGTFAENGPTKCSGIAIKQYSETSMSACFQAHFEKISSQAIDHHTPFDTVQHFIFCSFRRKS